MCVCASKTTVRGFRNQQAKHGFGANYRLLPRWCLPHWLASPLSKHPRVPRCESWPQRDGRPRQVPLPGALVDQLQRDWNYQAAGQTDYAAIALPKPKQNQTHSLSRQVHLLRKAMAWWESNWANRWYSNSDSPHRAKHCKEQRRNHWYRARRSSESSRIEYLSKPHR